MPLLKRFAYLLTILSIFEMHSTTLAQVPVEPNIILIVCDDLNDFEGVFGGHPQAQTPNMDALAASGVTFINAHSNAPICGPSRSSFVTGIYPHTSNNYAFENWYNPEKSNFAVNPILENSKTLMRYMRDNGYKAYGTGKIMHHDLDDDYVFPTGHPQAGQVQQDWDETGAKATYGPIAFDPNAINSSGGLGVTVNHPKIPQTFFEGAKALNSLFGSLADVPTINGVTGWWKSGWYAAGAFNYVSDSNRDLMQDEEVSAWASNKLAALGASDPNGTDEKFFMAVGFHNPHTPLVAPQEYFDLYPLETLQMPASLENDLDDTYFHKNLKPSTSTIKCYTSLVDSVGEASADGTTYATKEDFIKAYLQAYLACVSFVDAQVGTLMAALQASPYANNTIVILTSDHGYEFGEKHVLSKNTLWENSTRVPLVIRVPGLEANNGKQVDEPVALIDLYPTVRDFCGFTTDTKKNPQGADLDGHSLRPLLENPEAGQWDGPEVALSMVSGNLSDNPNQKNFAVRSKDWRYIRYENGAEELYDIVNDPNLFTNLIGSTDAQVQAKYTFLVNALFDHVPNLASAGTNLLIDSGFEWLDESSAPDAPVVETGSSTTTTSETAVLAGWHTWDAGTGSKLDDATPNLLASGMSAVAGINAESTYSSVGGGYQVQTNVNSSITTSSTWPGVAISDNSVASIRPAANSQRSLDFRITNNSGSDVSLTEFQFQYRKAENTTPSTTAIELTHLAGISDLNVSSAYVIATLTPASTYTWYNVSVDLTTLSDTVLANGESAAFRLSLPNLSRFTIWNVDNVAISGTTVTTVVSTPSISLRSPWVSNETSNAFEITRENSVVYEENYAVGFKNQWNTPTILQELSDVLDSEKEYVLSFWMRRGADGGLGGVNDASIDAELWSSATVDGTYTQRADFVTSATNSVADTWQRFEGSIDASTLASYNGEYLQIRMIRNTNVKQLLFIDSLELSAHTLNSFESWAFDEGVNPIAKSYDIDGDSFSNFEEFAMGGAPKDSASKAYSLQLESNGNDFIFSYPKRKNSNLNYSVESSATLNGPWSTGGVIGQPTTESMDANYDKVNNTISGSQSKQFVRLKIQAN